MTHIPETRLSLYAGGELDASDASVTAQHLEQCVECRKKADEFRLAAEWLKSDGGTGCRTALHSA